MASKPSLYRTMVRMVRAAPGARGARRAGGAAAAPGRRRRPGGRGRGGSGRCRAEGGEGEGGEAPGERGDPGAPGAPPSPFLPEDYRRKRVRKAESTDAVATFLTRRFGLAGGLAWLGVLTFGVVSEQIKTRLEVASEERGAREVADAREEVLAGGVRVRDLKLGGGQYPAKGLLVVLHYKGYANGELFEDTRQGSGKPLVYFYGSRPFTGGLCLGVEQALAGMKAGGKREARVPAALGFGAQGTTLRGTLHVPDKGGVVPPDADLTYLLELERVSIAPS